MKASIKVINTLFSLCLAIPAYAQTVPAERPTLPAEQKQLALALLNQTVAEIPALTKPENRIAATISLLELVWEQDGKKGRTLFAQVIADYIKTDKEYRRKSEEGNSSIIGLPLLAAERAKLLEFVSSRDAQLTWDTFLATRPKSDEKEVGIYLQEGETELAATLINLIGKGNPVFAAQKAESFLSQNGLHDFTWLIPRLLPSHTTTASRLTKKMFELIKETPAKNPADVFSARTAVSGNAGDSNNEIILESLFLVATGVSIDETSTAAAMPFDPVLLTEILDWLVKTRMESLTSNQRIVNLTQLFQSPDVFPQIEKQAAKLANHIKAKLQANRQTLTPEEAQFYKLQENPAPSSPPNITIDQLVEIAEKSTGDTRERYYQEAANLALEKKDFKRLRQLLAHVKETDLMLAGIEAEELATASEQGDLDRAHELLENNPSLIRKISVLSKIAEVQFQRGNQKLAASLLSEMQQILGTRWRNKEELECQTRLAAAIARINPPQSFTLLESLASRMNDIILAAATLHEVWPDYDTDPTEFYIWGQNSYSTYLMQQLEVLSQLARTDTKRAIAFVNKYQRREVRFLANAAICKSILTKSK